MPYYPDEVIDEVRSRNDIVDVIGQYVRLTKKGSNYFGLCPFHTEKTGSFSVNREKQMFYCFGCGAGGNVISFVMDYENYSFNEAVKYLADRAGINLPETEESPEEKREASFRQSVLECLKSAAVYYYKLLYSPEGRMGLEYLKKRGLSDDTIRSFGLGYSGKGFDKAVIRGNLYADDEYNGCPYCKAVTFVQCGRCGKLSCWNNEERITCGWCGLTGNITKTTDAIDVKSGDM